MTDTAVTSGVTITPANEASWEDLQAVLGTRGDPSRCQCQRYKMQRGESWNWSAPLHAGVGRAQSLSLIPSMPRSTCDGWLVNSP